MKSAALFLACSLLLATPALRVRADDATFGTVLTAKTGTHAVLLWDATPLVTQIVQNKEPSDQAMHALQAKAMQIASQHAMALAGAQTITVQTVYQKTGAVSPTYGSATFAGVEKLFSLTAPAGAAKSDGAALSGALQKGTTPKDVTITVTGQLPPA